MKTYTETRGEEPFDWNAFLNKEEIAEAEWDEAYYLSNDWVTCACGNQCSVIPRNVIGMPIDVELSTLGYHFNVAILESNPVEAKRILEKIEIRSSELIAEINETR